MPEPREIIAVVHARYHGTAVQTEDWDISAQIIADLYQLGFDIVKRAV